MWYLSIETPLRKNSIRLLYLICSELFIKSCSLFQLWENSPISPQKKQHRNEVFFGKVDGIKHQNLLKWNPTISVFHGNTEIIYWWIFEIHQLFYPCKITDEFCSSPLVIFQNMAYIFMQVIRNGKTFHHLSIFYYHNLAKCSVFN